MRGKKREGGKEQAWRVGHGWWTAAGVCGGRFVWTCPHNPHTSPFRLGPLFVRSFVRPSVPPFWLRHSTGIKARLRLICAYTHDPIRVFNRGAENLSTWRKGRDTHPIRAIEKTKQFRPRVSEFLTMRKQTSLIQQQKLTKKCFIRFTKKRNVWHKAQACILYIFLEKKIYIHLYIVDIIYKKIIQSKISIRIFIRMIFRLLCQLYTSLKISNLWEKHIIT